MPAADHYLPLDAKDHGVRLDQAVARHTGVSRQAAARLIGRGAVLVNGRPGVKGQSVTPDDRVVVPNDAGRECPVPRPDLPLVILAQGAGWVAVDKPTGVGVHPLEPGQDDTVLNALVARYPQVLGVGEGGLRSGVVHRLDLPTTGTLLFATEQARWLALRDAFTEHRVCKTYHALVHGRLVGQGAESMRLAVTRHRPAKVSVVEPSHPEARVCRLSWRAVETMKRATLVEVDLHTGFLHQVRVMMSALGHPLLGDRDYGRADEAPRVMLHAQSIHWQDVLAACESPPDFEAALQRCRGNG